jgi:hypothetical protein
MTSISTYRDHDISVRELSSLNQEVNRNRHKAPSGRASVSLPNSGKSKTEVLKSAGISTSAGLPSSGKTKAQTLKDAGISTSAAQRAEKLAAHTPAVEAYIAKKAATTRYPPRWHGLFVFAVGSQPMASPCVRVRRPLAALHLGSHRHQPSARRSCASGGGLNAHSDASQNQRRSHSPPAGRTLPPSMARPRPLPVEAHGWDIRDAEGTPGRRGFASHNTEGER